MSPLCRDLVARDLLILMGVLWLNIHLLTALKMYPKWLAYPMSMFYRCWGLQTHSGSLAERHLSPKLCLLKMSFSSLGLYPFPNILLYLALMGVMCFDSQHFNFISCWSVHGGSVCFFWYILEISFVTEIQLFLLAYLVRGCHRTISMQIFGTYFSKSVASLDHMSFISIVYAH